MRRTKISTIRGLVVLGALLWLAPSVGEAATTQVDCSSASLQGAVDKAKPGDTLLVSGTCKENLVIYEEVVRVTLDGQGKTTINGPDASKPTIEVRGRGITIKGFTVTGGGHGINVLRGGQAVIDGNTVQNSGGHGILLTENSVATILNNKVKNSRLNGIIVSSNSTAWVGVLSTRDKTPRPNIIENNGSFGIVLVRSSAARIVGNTIRNNKRSGVGVFRGSVGHISGNTIDANGWSGISVNRNSHVSIKGGRTKIFRLPNSTTSNNSGFGIMCEGNYSSVDGPLGSLNGEEGVKDIDPSCVASLGHEPAHAH